jgi:hypothetical protein
MNANDDNWQVKIGDSDIDLVWENIKLQGHREFFTSRSDMQDTAKDTITFSKPFNYFSMETNCYAEQFKPRSL